MNNISTSNLNSSQDGNILRNLSDSDQADITNVLSNSNSRIINQTTQQGARDQLAPMRDMMNNNNNNNNRTSVISDEDGPDDLGGDLMVDTTRNIRPALTRGITTVSELEGAGDALDLTGLGAIAGVGLNIAGIVGGAISSIVESLEPVHKAPQLASVPFQLGIDS